MTNQDRIKLAEAMYGCDKGCDSESYAVGCKVHDFMAFNPFTDANDDYAVLEWAIKNLNADAYFNAMTEVVGSYCYLHEYRIGYFARAALKVIDNG